nr:diguanylate cyclase [Ideonella oryzae]
MTGLRISLAQPEAAESLLQQVRELARQGPVALRRDAEVASSCLQGDLARLQGSLTRADEPLEEAMRLLDAGTAVPIHMSCLVIHSSVEENLGHFDEAARLTQQALRLVDRGQPWRRSELLSGLAYIYLRAGQRERARHLNDEAKVLAQANEDWVSLSEATTVESILLTDEGKEMQALQSLSQSIQYARQAGDQLSVAMGLANLSDHYLRQGDYRQAYAQAQQALPLARQLRSSEVEQLADFNTGLALIAMRRKDEGLPLVREVLDQQRRADEVVPQAEALADLAHYLEKAGYLSEALQVYREHRAMSEQAFQRSQQKALVELQESFDAERRKHERSLLTDDNQLKEEALRQTELRFKLWALVMAGVGMAVLLLALLHRRMKAAQKALHSVNERLKVQSEQDPLTGLANRRHFQRLMAQGEDAGGTLYLLDLDHFKRINDNFGHAGGDAVLIEVARRLQAVLREEDVVVRWGGEEFMILVPGEGGEPAELLAQRLLTALASLPVVVGPDRVAVTASIGFGSFPLQPQQLDVPWSMAIDLVDAAMYIAKTQGRNRAVGIRRMTACDLDMVARQMQDLEAVWRRDEAQLVEIHGPDVVGQTE